ncbi:PREDICTED: UPF0544 protein C5orf45 homolog [Chaetura pelagica]|uniref:UPF0544 protein C5orf45 homolog n=1 Tax=Chaetura pelagica TaxID=8897 RepID=UPI0005231602|nr:PREDICTED: UPF0544 protein C5orf45 homolog [Chaetura pelagica]
MGASCGGQRQAVQKVYGQGSGLECRHHVQKLNLLQGEAEEAIRWTSRTLNEGRAGASRWSKYLDKDSEDQEDGEEKAGTERQQFCSQGKNTVEEQRKHQMFLSSDVQEHAEENQVFQLAYQAKKRRKCLVAATNQDREGAVSADSVVPAACESVVPEENAQTPTACTKPSKWEKFLASSDNYSKNGARVISSPQEGSGRMGLHSTTAAGAEPSSVSCEHLFCTGEEFDDDL